MVLGTALALHQLGKLLLAFAVLYAVTDPESASNTFMVINHVIGSTGLAIWRKSENVVVGVFTTGDGGRNTDQGKKLNIMDDCAVTGNCREVTEILFAGIGKVEYMSVPVYWGVRLPKRDALAVIPVGGSSGVASAGRFLDVASVDSALGIANTGDALSVVSVDNALDAGQVGDGSGVVPVYNVGRMTGPSVKVYSRNGTDGKPRFFATVVKVNIKNSKSLLKKTGQELLDAAAGISTNERIILVALLSCTGIVSAVVLPILHAARVVLRSRLVRRVLCFPFKSQLHISFTLISGMIGAGVLLVMAELLR